MARRVSVLRLKLIERWFSLASTYVNWGGDVTHFFKVIASVRQGGALFPCLFTTYVDDIVNKNIQILFSVVIFHFTHKRIFCMLMTFCFCHHLLMPFRLLLIYERKLLSLDLCLNHNKSICIHVGRRFNAGCATLTTCNGHELELVKATSLPVRFLLPADHSNVVGKIVKPAFTAPFALYSVASVDTLRLM